MSELVIKIGSQAGIKVSTDGSGRSRFASVHDLRRSFGERWVAKPMPQQLMERMRNESIETTLRYYVGRNAKRTAAALWQAHDTAGQRHFYNIGVVWPQVRARACGRNVHL